MNSVLAWLSVWFLASGWLLLVNYFLPPDGRGWAFAAAGTLLFLLAGRRVRWQKVDPWLFLLAAPLALAALIWPLPYKAGPLLVLGGLLVTVMLRRASWLSPLGVGLALTGAVWMAQGGASVAYWWLGARYHEAGFLTPIIHGLARFLDWTAGSSQGSLYLPHVEEMIQATTTWERLGAFPVMLLAAGGLVLLPLVKRQSGRTLLWRMVGALALGAGYLMARYLVLLAVVAINRDPAIYWQTLPTALSFLPLCLLLARVLPLRRSIPAPLPPGERVGTGRYLALGAMAFLAGTAALGWLLFPAPGREKAGRVLLDEYNSNWEWSTQALDTEWYGQKSGYNYYSLGQWLAHYYQVDTNFEERTPELLADYDVLIIKTPTAAFAPEELEAIDAWVEAGGGLFLIGDHTNVFGTSSYLNPLARRFGLRFRYDSTYDLPTLRVTQYARPKLLAHPAVLEMPPFLFATSSTLEAPLLAENVMVGYGLRALPVDYARRVFFPDKEKERDYPFGLFLQSAAVRHGRGRVLAFTDSTVFSNFTMFLAGKPEYFLGVMNWLNRANNWPWLRGALALVALLAGGGTIYLAWRLRQGRAWIVLLGALLLAAAIGPWVSHQIARAAYPLPEPHTPYVRVAFEGEHSRIDLPTTPGLGPPEASFQTFYVWTQRLGYVPSFSPTLEESLDRADVLVLVDPSSPFDAGELAAVQAFVADGGRLLVLADADKAGQEASAASQILEPFGLGLQVRRTTQAMLYNSEGESLGQLQVGGIVEGGEPLLTLAGEEPVVSLAHHGEGMVVATSFAQPFSDREMGTTAVVPSRQQRFRFEIEFWLLQGLVSGDFPPLHLPGSPGQ